VILLDTNVISELTRPKPEQKVMRYLESLPEHQTYITCITVQELWAGTLQLPPGTRRTGLEVRTRRIVDEMFVGRVLEYTLASAWICGKIIASNLQRGHRPNEADAQIAAIAMLNRMAVVTRNTGDFDHEGLTVINPWDT
jgi:toxin FitB